MTLDKLGKLIGGYLEQRFRRLCGKFDFLHMGRKVAGYNKAVLYGTFPQEVQIDLTTS